MKKLFSLLVVVAVICALSMTAFAAPVVISGFDAADIAAYMNFNTGLTGNPFFIGAPTIEAVDALDGKGVKITATAAAAASVQSFLVQNADALAALTNIANDKVMSVYVKNTSDIATFGLRIGFTSADQNGMSVFDCTEAVVKDMDGNEVTYTTADGGGTGEGTSVVIPASFEGFVYLPFTALNLTVEGWGKTLITDYSTVGTIDIDARVNFGDAAEISYILDSLQIIDEIPVETPSETADLSVIAYAVAALTGCGALVVAGKRK